MSHKNDNQKRFALQLLIMTSAVFILLFGGWRLAAIEFEDIAPIKNVEIEGRFVNLSLSEMKQKVANVLEGGYFTVDLKTIRNALLQLPWVQDASIRRQWPSGLHIKVVEKQAVAYWGKVSMLSDRGDLFTPVSINHEMNLPKLEGPEGLHKTVWAFLEKIENDFTGMNMIINRLVLDERRAWRMNVSDNAMESDIEVMLGRENTYSRLDRFVRVFTNNTALDLKQIVTVDLRYPNGFALRMKNTNITTINKEAGLVREV